MGTAKNWEHTRGAVPPQLLQIHHIRVADVLVDGIGKWQRRSLKNRYTAIMIDAGFFNMRRGTAEKECIHFALGIDDEGHGRYWGSGVIQLSHEPAGNLFQ